VVMRDLSKRTRRTLPGAFVVGCRSPRAEDQDQRPTAKLGSLVAPNSDSRTARPRLEPERYGRCDGDVSTRGASSRLALPGAGTRMRTDGQSAPEAVGEARRQTAGSRRGDGLRPTEDRKLWKRFTVHYTAQARELAQPRRDRGEPLGTRMPRQRPHRDALRVDRQNARMEHPRESNAAKNRMAFHDAESPASVSISATHYAWGGALVGWRHGCTAFMPSV
jgi:hypothetical protein